MEKSTTAHAFGHWRGNNKFRVMDLKLNLTAIANGDDDDGSDEDNKTPEYPLREDHPLAILNKERLQAFNFTNTPTTCIPTSLSLPKLGDHSTDTAHFAADHTRPMNRSSSSVYERINNCVGVNTTSLNSTRNTTNFLYKSEPCSSSISDIQNLHCWPSWNPFNKSTKTSPAHNCNTSTKTSPAHNCNKSTKTSPVQNGNKSTKTSPVQNCCGKLGFQALNLETRSYSNIRHSQVRKTCRNKNNTFHHRSLFDCQKEDNGCSSSWKRPANCRVVVNDHGVSSSVSNASSVHCIPFTDQNNNAPPRDSGGTSSTSIKVQQQDDTTDVVQFVRVVPKSEKNRNEDIIITSESTKAVHNVMPDKTVDEEEDNKDPPCLLRMDHNDVVSDDSLLLRSPDHNHQPPTLSPVNNNGSTQKNCSNHSPGGTGSCSVVTSQASHVNTSDHNNCISKYSLNARQCKSRTSECSLEMMKENDTTTTTTTTTVYSSAKSNSQKRLEDERNENVSLESLSSLVNEIDNSNHVDKKQIDLNFVTDCSRPLTVTVSDSSFQKEEGIDGRYDEDQVKREYMLQEVPLLVTDSPKSHRSPPTPESIPQTWDGDPVTSKSEIKGGTFEIQQDLEAVENIVNENETVKMFLSGVEEDSEALKVLETTSNIPPMCKFEIQGLEAAENVVHENETVKMFISGVEEGNEALKVLETTSNIPPMCTPASFTSKMQGLESADKAEHESETVKMCNNADFAGDETLNGFETTSNNIPPLCLPASLAEQCIGSQFNDSEEYNGDSNITPQMMEFERPPLESVNTTESTDDNIACVVKHENVASPALSDGSVSVSGDELESDIITAREHEQSYSEDDNMTSVIINTQEHEQSYSEDDNMTSIIITAREHEQSYSGDDNMTSDVAEVGVLTLEPVASPSFHSNSNPNSDPENLYVRIPSRPPSVDNIILTIDMPHDVAMQNGHGVSHVPQTTQGETENQYLSNVSRPKNMPIDLDNPAEIVRIISSVVNLPDPPFEVGANTSFDSDEIVKTNHVSHSFSVNSSSPNHSSPHDFPVTCSSPRPTSTKSNKEKFNSQISLSTRVSLVGRTIATRCYPYSQQRNPKFRDTNRGKKVDKPPTKTLGLRYKSNGRNHRYLSYVNSLRTPIVSSKLGRNHFSTTPSPIQNKRRSSSKELIGSSRYQANHPSTTRPTGPKLSSTVPTHTSMPLYSMETSSSSSSHPSFFSSAPSLQSSESGQSSAPLEPGQNSSSSCSLSIGVRAHDQPDCKDNALQQLLFTLTTNVPTLSVSETIDKCPPVESSQHGINPATTKLTEPNLSPTIPVPNVPPSTSIQPLHSSLSSLFPSGPPTQTTPITQISSIPKQEHHDNSSMLSNSSAAENTLDYPGNSSDLSPQRNTSTTFPVLAISETSENLSSSGSRCQTHPSPRNETELTLPQAVHNPVVTPPLSSTEKSSFLNSSLVPPVVTPQSSPISQAYALPKYCDSSLASCTSVGETGHGQLNTSGETSQQQLPAPSRTPSTVETSENWTSFVPCQTNSFTTKTTEHRIPPEIPISNPPSTFNLVESSYSPQSCIVSSGLSVQSSTMGHISSAVNSTLVSDVSIEKKPLESYVCNKRASPQCTTPSSETVPIFTTDSPSPFCSRVQTNSCTSGPINSKPPSTTNPLSVLITNPRPKPSIESSSLPTSSHFSFGSSTQLAATIGQTQAVVDLVDSTSSKLDASIDQKSYDLRHSSDIMTTAQIITSSSTAKPTLTVTSTSTRPADDTSFHSALISSSPLRTVEHRSFAMETVIDLSVSAHSSPSQSVATATNEEERREIISSDQESSTRQVVCLSNDDVTMEIEEGVSETVYGLLKMNAQSSTMEIEDGVSETDYGLFKMNVQSSDTQLIDLSGNENEEEEEVVVVRHSPMLNEIQTAIPFLNSTSCERNVSNFSRANSPTPSEDDELVSFMSTYSHPKENNSFSNRVTENCAFPMTAISAVRKKELCELEELASQENDDHPLDERSTTAMVVKPVPSPVFLSGPTLISVEDEDSRAADVTVTKDRPCLELPVKDFFTTNPDKQSYSSLVQAVIQSKKQQTTTRKSPHNDDEDVLKFLSNGRPVSEGDDNSVNFAANGEMIDLTSECSNDEILSISSEDEDTDTADEVGKPHLSSCLQEHENESSKSISIITDQNSNASESAKTDDVEKDTSVTNASLDIKSDQIPPEEPKHSEESTPNMKTGGSIGPSKSPRTPSLSSKDTVKSLADHIKKRAFKMSLKKKAEVSAKIHSIIVEKSDLLPESLRSESIIPGFCGTDVKVKGLEMSNSSNDENPTPVKESDPPPKPLQNQTNLSGPIDTGLQKVPLEVSNSIVTERKHHTGNEIVCQEETAASPPKEKADYSERSPMVQTTRYNPGPPPLLSVQNATTALSGNQTPMQLLRQTALSGNQSPIQLLRPNIPIDRSRNSNAAYNYNNTGQLPAPAPPSMYITSSMPVPLPPPIMSMSSMPVPLPASVNHREYPPPRDSRARYLNPYPINNEEIPVLNLSTKRPPERFRTVWCSRFVADNSSSSSVIMSQPSKSTHSQQTPIHERHHPNDMNNKSRPEGFHNFDPLLHKLELLHAAKSISTATIKTSLATGQAPNNPAAENRQISAVTSSQRSHPSSQSPHFSHTQQTCSSEPVDLSLSNKDQSQNSKNAAGKETITVGTSINDQVRFFKDTRQRDGNAGGASNLNDVYSEPRAILQIQHDSYGNNQKATNLIHTHAKSQYLDGRHYTQTSHQPEIEIRHNNPPFPANHLLSNSGGLNLGQHQPGPRNISPIHLPPNYPQNYPQALKFVTPNPKNHRMQMGLPMAASSVDSEYVTPHGFPARVQQTPRNGDISFQNNRQHPNRSESAPVNVNGAYHGQNVMHENIKRAIVSGNNLAYSKQPDRLEHEYSHNNFSAPPTALPKLLRAVPDPLQQTLGLNSNHPVNVSASSAVDNQQHPSTLRGNSSGHRYPPGYANNDKRNDFFQMHARPAMNNSQTMNNSYFNQQTDTRQLPHPGDKGISNGSSKQMPFVLSNGNSFPQRPLNDVHHLPATIITTNHNPIPYPRPMVSNNNIATNFPHTPPSVSFAEQRLYPTMASPAFYPGRNKNMRPPVGFHPGMHRVPNPNAIRHGPGAMGHFPSQNEKSYHPYGSPRPVLVRGDTIPQKIMDYIVKNGVAYKTAPIFTLSNGLTIEPNDIVRKVGGTFTPTHPYNKSDLVQNDVTAHWRKRKSTRTKQPRSSTRRKKPRTDSVESVGEEAEADNDTLVIDETTTTTSSEIASTDTAAAATDTPTHPNGAAASSPFIPTTTIRSGSASTPITPNIATEQQLAAVLERDRDSPGRNAIMNLSVSSSGKKETVGARGYNGRDAMVGSEISNTVNAARGTTVVDMPTHGGLPLHLKPLLSGILTSKTNKLNNNNNNNNDNDTNNNSFDLGAGIIGGGGTESRSDSGFSDSAVALDQLIPTSIMPMEYVMEEYEESGISYVSLQPLDDGEDNEEGGETSENSLLSSTLGSVVVSSKEGMVLPIDGHGIVAVDSVLKDDGENNMNMVPVHQIDKTSNSFSQGLSSLILASQKIEASLVENNMEPHSPHNKEQHNNNNLQPKTFYMNETDSGTRATHCHGSHNNVEVLAALTASAGESVSKPVVDEVAKIMARNGHDSNRNYMHKKSRATALYRHGITEEEKQVADLLIKLQTPV